MKIKLDPISIFVISIIVGLFSAYYFNDFLTKVVGIEPKKSKYTLMEEEKIKYLQNLGINPYNQYGTTYRIGNFGGMPVMLDERFGSQTQYSADRAPDKNGKYPPNNPPPDTFDNPIHSIWFEFRHTDNKVFVRYKTAPRDIIKQYDYESNYEPNHAWISAHFSAFSEQEEGIYENQRAKNLFSFNAHNESRKVYVKSGIEYGLEKYVLNEYSKSIYNEKLFDDMDLYVSKDEKGNYINIIQCQNSNNPLVRWCKLYFSYQMKTFIGASVGFQRAHLKDWQKIKQQSIDLLMDVVVKD